VRIINAASGNKSHKFEIVVSAQKYTRMPEMGQINCKISKKIPRKSIILKTYM